MLVQLQKPSSNVVRSFKYLIHIFNILVFSVVNLFKWMGPLHSL